MPMVKVVARRGRLLRPSVGAGGHGRRGSWARCVPRVARLCCCRVLLPAPGAFDPLGDTRHVGRRHRDARDGRQKEIARVGALVRLQRVERGTLARRGDEGLGGQAVRAPFDRRRPSREDAAVGAPRHAPRRVEPCRELDHRHAAAQREEHVGVAGAVHAHHRARAREERHRAAHILVARVLDHHRGRAQPAQPRAQGGQRLGCERACPVALQRRARDRRAAPRDEQHRPRLLAAPQLLVLLGLRRRRRRRRQRGARAGVQRAQELPRGGRVPRALRAWHGAQPMVDVAARLGQPALPNRQLEPCAALDVVEVGDGRRAATLMRRHVDEAHVAAHAERRHVRPQHAALPEHADAAAAAATRCRRVSRRVVQLADQPWPDGRHAVG